MVGYTALGQKNESLSLALVDEQRKLLRPIFKRHDGKEIKTMGDAFLVEFPSALDAVRCAYDIQRATREFNISLPNEKRVHLRVGVHLGDVVESQGDISGDAVNVASRIEPLAEDGGVCLTQQVYDHVQNKFELPLMSMGKKTLKNVLAPLEVYRIVMPWEVAEAPKSQILDRNRLAVLPFVNMSPDPNDEYFADGLTDELISKLSQVGGLEVIARTSVMNYKKKEKNISQIGRELEVGTIMEGSVRKAGNRIRVTAQLINVNTEGHLWSSSYDRDLEDIFAIQTDIATKVSESAPAAINRKGSGVPGQETRDLEAYTSFLRGSQLLYQSSEESLREAVKLFEKAIERDPSFARAYVGLANCHLRLGNIGYDPYAESVERARARVRQALELSEDLAEAHAALSVVMFNEDDLIGSENEAKKAIELNPNLPEAYEALSGVAANRGDATETVRLIETYYRLDPIRPSYVSDMGRAYFYVGRESEALEHWSKTSQFAPFGTYVVEVEYYIVKGDLEKANELLGMAEKLQPTHPETLWLRGYVAAVKGERDQALRMIELIQLSNKGDLSFNWIGFIRYALGDLDGFFDCMNKALERHALNVVELMHSPLFAKVRTDPRYDALLARMKSMFWPESR
jgi:TolB-like protein/Flp pilus assembly protein TadD